MVHHNAPSMTIQSHSCTQLRAWRRSYFSFFAKAPSAGAVPLFPTRFRRIVLPISDHQSLYKWTHLVWSEKMIHISPPWRKESGLPISVTIKLLWLGIPFAGSNFKEWRRTLHFGFTNLSQQTKLPISTTWTIMNINTSKLCVPTFRGMPW